MRIMGTIGKGIIISIGGNKKVYLGTIPFSNQEKVVLMKQSDLELILRTDVNSLIVTPLEMPEKFYTREKTVELDGEDYPLPPLLPDELDYKAPDSTKHKLFLDRSFYSHNPKDMIWVRYVSIDQSFFEENGREENKD